jgi:hypothetical protein
VTITQWRALRDEVWQAPDGTVTWVVCATEQPSGLLVTLGNGYSGYYADLTAARYVQLG